MDRGDSPNPLLDELNGADPVIEKRSNGYRDRSNDTEADLLTFIAANGGLRDDEGHNLKAWRNIQRPIAGLGSLIRKDGKSIDMMRERLVESGWLPEDATEADALDLIDRANFRQIYHPQSQNFLKAQTANQEPEGEVRSRIAAEAQALGLETFGEREMGYAVDNVAEGMGERDAILWALDRAISEETEGTVSEPQEETYVPGFDAARDAEATRPEPAPARADEGREQPGAVEGAPREGESPVARPEPADRSAVSEEDAANFGPGYRIEREGEGFQAFYHGKRIGENGRVGNSVPAAATRFGAMARIGRHTPPEEGPSTASIKDTPSGKGVIVSGATEAQLAAIKAALPDKASGIEGREGWTFSKKHEDKIRGALGAVSSQDAAGTRTDGAPPYAQHTRQCGAEG